LARLVINRRGAMRVLGETALGAGLGTGLGGCLSLPGFDASTTAPSQPAPVAPGPGGGVAVGLIAPLTAGGQTAVVGNTLKNAAEMALAEFQGANVRLIVKDDKGTPDGGRAAAQELLAEGTEIVLGPLNAPSVQAAASVLRPAGRPMIAFTTDASLAAQGVYLMSFLPEGDVSRVVTFAAQQGRRSFAGLIPDTAYGRVVEAAFQQVAAARGVRVVGLERYAVDQGKLEAAVAKLAPSFGQIDALFAPETPEITPAVLRALQTAGLNAQRVKLLGTGTWNDARLFRLPQMQGAWFASAESSGFNAFAQRYQQRFGGPPTRLGSLSYTAVTLVAALGRQQGSQRFAPNVLTNPEGFAGMDGLFRFRPDGTIERGLAVLEVRGEGAVTVSPAPSRFVAA
jgi:ABC-type branched-subunit amino acid transport system substrate-binding protein